MDVQSVDSSTLLQYLSEEKYDESIEKCFENLTSDDIKQFMIQLGSILLKDLNEKSKLNIMKMINDIHKFHANELINHLKLALTNIAKFLISGHNCQDGFTGFGSSSCFALQLLTSVLLKPGQSNNDSFKHLMQLVVLLPSGCLLSGKKNVIINCKKTLQNFLQKSPLAEQIINIVNSSDSKIPFFGFMIIVADIAALKSKLTRETVISYLKFCFNDKSVVPANLLIAIKPLIEYGIKTKTDFDEHLLPIIQRATLRSPEKSLWIIKIFLNHIDFLDLSSESDELSKVFAVQLQSKLERLRNEAKDCLRSVVRSSSESESIKRIVGQIERLLLQSGSEKISSVEIRQHIYNTITELGRNVTVGSSELTRNISETVLSMLTDLVGKETSEPVIIAALDGIAQWSTLSTGQVPLALASWLKTTIFNPKHSSTLRAHYMACFNSCYGNTEKLSGLTTLLPQLQDLLDKTAKSPATISTVVEIVPIIELLVRYLVHVDNVTGDRELQKSSPIFNATIHQIGLKSNIGNVKLFSDQLLTNAPANSLRYVLSIIRYTLLQLPELVSQLPDHRLMMLRFVFICAMHNDYHAVRRPALETITQLARSRNGEPIAIAFLDYIYSLNLSDAASLVGCCFWPLDTGADGAVSIHDINSLATVGQRVAQVIDALLKLELPQSTSKLSRSLLINGASRFPVWWDRDARARLMSAALLPVNQHMITHFQLDLWAKHAQNLLDSTEQIAALSGNEIIDRLTNLTQLTRNDASVIRCLCRNFSDRFIDQLLHSVTGNLYRDQFISCTEDEVGIMNTRDGYLYNKIFLHSLPKYEISKGNIKRENKMYSYKDQMAEVEMRKELENKKIQNQPATKAEDRDSDNPLILLSSQLTKNQMEQVNIELDKEKRVRNRMKELESQVNLMCDLLESVSELRKECFLNHFDQIIIALNKLIIGSPVARVRAALLYNKLRTLVNLNQEQSVWSLRVILLDSSIYTQDFIDNWVNNKNGQQLMELIKPWMGKNLAEYSSDLIEAINKQILAKKYLKFPTFLYLLPAFCRLAQSIADMACPATDDSQSQWWCYLTWMDIDLLMKILDIFHRQISTGDIDKKQLFNTELLPVLVKVIQNSDVHGVQSVVENIVLSMMNRFGESKGDTLKVSDTTVLDILLKCFISDTVQARLLALESISVIDELLEDEFCDRLTEYLWIANHDTNEAVKEKSLVLWNKLDLSVDEQLLFKLQEFVILPHDHIMCGAIGGITSLVEKYGHQLDPLVRNIFKLYDEFAYLKPPVCDAFGRVLVASPPDQWRARYGLSKTLLALSKFISEKDLVESLFNFFIPKALSDRHHQVRTSMLESGQKVIETSGKGHINMLLPIMENYLLNAANIVENDIIRQSIVILMGSLAKHLDASDERFVNIFGKLIAALNFPSAEVQRSVSDTFDPLIKAFDEEKQREICNSLLQVMLSSNVEAERKGAAFGIAGIIKAVGITKLKQFKIHDALIEAIQDKQNEKHREIALFTFEQISAKMNKMFEPYVPGILKYLQDSFADPSNLVRQTADRTAKMLMSNLSAPGVKIVLNPLLAGLDTNQWRTKAVSVELLGSMAFCAPKQLSNCLPTIVPKILTILSDSHPNVIKAGRQALRQIGSVIHNKEVQGIVPILIDALCEPNKKTNEGLDALIGIKFIHQVDAASLSLIMSMVARAFKERRSDTKKKAAQIIGNLHSLTDDKDLQPYCASLLPGLKNCLVDPDPDVRAVASRSLGTVAKVMSPAVFEELLYWLMETIKDEVSAVNRSGAAQGLSEVFMQKGIDHLDKFMPSILDNTRNQKLLANVRDGYLMLYIYLPKLFQEEFAGYVEQILPSILQALSDEVDFIRQTALTAGQGIIETYSHIAIDTMLPNLELGMLDGNCRIRYSSIRLLGELLFRLTGISGKGTTSGGTEDESFAQTTSHDILIESLGQATYSRVLAKIYISRMDIGLQVKQTATHIWKLMVVNTARTLRWIMKDLMEIILGCLSDDNEDSRVMCTKTLGDVVKKLGERILPDIFGYLDTGFEQCQAGQRIGICTAISEILKASPRDQISNYLDKILPTFKNCMIDEDEKVRLMAGEIFELLHSALGVKIVDIIIPDLVDKLEEPAESDNALNGLCTLVSFKGRIVIPSLIPKLTHPTVNTKAFSKLAKVAGDILARHIISVLPALLQAVSNVIGASNEAGEVDNCCQVILAMNDPQVTQIIAKDLTQVISGSKLPNEQIAALKIMSGYIKGSKELDSLVSNRSLMNYMPVIIRSAVKLFLSDNRQILVSSFDCVADIITSLGSHNIEYVKDIRDSILTIIRERASQTGTTIEQVLVPAFCLTERGINPFIELYREALVNGRCELKEVAASGMEDCITVTETEVLAKAAIKIAGPLIRTMAERHNSATKASIVSSLGKLIVKCPVQVKLFATQMQTIFIKCLADPNQPLRYKTSIAQSKLALIITKPDQFFTDFVVREFHEDNPYKATGMETVRFSLESAGHRLSRDTLISFIDIFKTTVGDKDDQVRVIGASCLGVALSNLAIEDMVQVKAVFDQNTSVLKSHSLAVSLIPFLKTGSQKLFSNSCPPDVTEAVVKALEEFCNSDKVFIASASYRALGYALSHLVRDKNSGRISELMPLLQNGMKNSAMEIKELVIEICGYLSWTDEDGANVALYAKPVLAILINGYRAKENHLRINSEKRIMDLVHLSIGLRKKVPGSGKACDIDSMDEKVYKTCYDSVEQGTKSALQEVVIRFKKTVLSGTKEVPTHCPELDNTYNKVVNE